MRVRLLGTAAGGGFPQWNCRCPNCRGVRAGTLEALPRTQSCVAISSDGERWFLVNASPDLRAQIESFPVLLASEGARGTAISGILLTSADLDHTLGLLLLREGERLVVHASSAVREAISEASGFANVLSHYCGIEWREPPTELADLRDSTGEPSGLKYVAFPVPGKPPRYTRQQSPTAGDAVAFRLVDPVTGGSLICAPGVASLGPAMLRTLAACDLLLLDGTFWDEDEMARAGVGVATASEMGHCPVGGPGGSLAQIGKLPVSRKVYMHINNTNPMLVSDGPERRAVDAAGLVVGEDGMDFAI